MATPPVQVEFTVEGLEQVKEAFREVASTSQETKQSIDRMDVSYKRLAFSIAHVGTAALAMESIFERVSSGQMSLIEGALRLIPTLISLAASIWTVVTAEKARAVASAIAHAVSSLGAAVPLIAAAAAAGAGIALAATTMVPSGAYEHIPVQQITSQRQILIFDIHDNRFAADYDADRTGQRIIDQLRRAGVI